MRYARILLNIALICFSVGFSIGIIEIFVRFYFDSKFGPRPSFWVMDQDLGWRPRPNLDHVFHGADFRTSIRTDSRGRRLGAAGEVAASSELVVTLGDSYTFGWGVDTDQTFPSYLDQKLAALSRCRVINLGVGGYGTLQSAHRLSELASELDGGPNENTIGAAIFMHSYNDMSDNVRFLQFLAGSTAHRTDSQNLSSWHSWNLARHAARSLWVRWNSGGTTADVPFRPVDRLTDFQLKETGRTGTVTFLGGIRVDTAGITEADLDQRKTVERGYLSALQDKLLQASIDHTHCAIRDHGTYIIHSVIHTAPTWYVDALRRIVNDANPCGNLVDFTGRIPPPSRCERCGFNEHSGGHFNAHLNEYYADAIVELLKARNVCAAG